MSERDPSARPSERRPRGWLGWWTAKPLYLRILWALVLGLIVGSLLQGYQAWNWENSEQAQAASERVVRIAEVLGTPGDLIMRLLGALAPPLILLAVVHTLLKAEIPARVRFRLLGLLLLNTLVAISIGL